MENKKMITAAKNLDIFAKVGSGMFKAASLVSFIFAVLVLIFGARMVEAGSLTLDLDFLKIHLADEFQLITAAMKNYIVVGLLIIGILCWTVGYAFGLVRKILAPMKEGRPFEDHIPESLRKIAWVALAGGAATQILGIAERMLATQAYPMEEIFSSDAITQLEYVYTVDFNFVWVACVILFLSYIFSYGQSLQQESDETL